MAYPDKVRLVIETQKAYLGSYSAEPVEDGLIIRVGDAAAVTPRPSLQLASAPPPAPAAPAVASGPAWVNRVEFADEPDGKSAVIIGTTRPIQYDMSKAGDKRVTLRLLNTSVSEPNRRPLITTRFESAVDRVTPAQGKGETTVAIDMRENVPYTAEQIGNVIRLNFAASVIPPKPYESAEPPAWKTTGAAPAVAPAVTVAAATGPPAAKPAVQPAVTRSAPTAAAPVTVHKTSVVETGSGDRVYTGEKIALDFYDTDIKNVFRILQEISGKNFAIDKNVTGKVTLALQKPVPWDQVLDLVLKMNQLGMVREGDIIRIASLTTLQQEEKMRQAQLKAEQDARKQEEEGEPLITEYIPVNYSNAKADVLPHLASILTPGRGKATVDDRNNQIIFTDIADKVAPGARDRGAHRPGDRPGGHRSARGRGERQLQPRDRLRLGHDHDRGLQDRRGAEERADQPDRQQHPEHLPHRQLDRLQLLHPVRDQHLDRGREADGERARGPGQHHLGAQDHHPQQQEGHHQAGPRGALPGARLFRQRDRAVQGRGPAPGGHAERLPGPAHRDEHLHHQERRGGPDRAGTGARRPTKPRPRSWSRTGTRS